MRSASRSQTNSSSSRSLNLTTSCFSTRWPAGAMTTGRDDAKRCTSRSSVGTLP